MHETGLYPGENQRALPRGRRRVVSCEGSSEVSLAFLPLFGAVLGFWRAEVLRNQVGWKGLITTKKRSKRTHVTSYDCQKNVFFLALRAIFKQRVQSLGSLRQLRQKLASYR